MYPSHSQISAFKFCLGGNISYLFFNLSFKYQNVPYDLFVIKNVYKNDFTLFKINMLFYPFFKVVTSARVLYYFITFGQVFLLAKNQFVLFFCKRYIITYCI